MTTAMEEWDKLTSKSMAKSLAQNIIRNEYTRKKPAQMIDLNLEAEFWLATGEVPSRLDIMKKLYPPNGDMWDPVPAVPTIKEIEDGITTYARRRDARMEFIKAFGFPIPCSELIEAIKAEGPLVELGAGSGYLAALVCRCGGCVIPTDSYKGGYFFEVSFYGKVRRLAASTAFREFPNMPILISWPSFGAKWPSRVANMLKPGCRLLYIGEDNGCTACYSFEDILRKKFKEIKQVSIPNWEGIHDHLRIFEKE